VATRPLLHGLRTFRRLLIMASNPTSMALTCSKCQPAAIPSTTSDYFPSLTGTFPTENAQPPISTQETSNTHTTTEPIPTQNSNTGASSQTGSSLSKPDKITLGTAIGLGAPGLLVSVLGVWYARKQYISRHTSGA
jgi:hypothetical protein